MISVLQTVRQLVSPGGIEGYFALKYDELAKNNEHMQMNYEGVAEKTATLVQEGEVLEIGPGPAYIAIAIAKRVPGVEITGLELSKTMIRIARKNAFESGVSQRISFRHGDASRMPFDDASFDFVVSSGSLHHWKRPEQVFNEIYRVLKQGHRALISDLRKDAPREKIDELVQSVSTRLMRWGLRHSFKEGYTVQDIEEILNKTPFLDYDIVIEEVVLEIQLRK